MANKNLLAVMKKEDGTYRTYDDVIAAIAGQPTVDAVEVVRGQWIPVAERLPDNFVSVLGYMTDAGPFPPVRECYNVGNGFFFPALEGIHSISHWMPLPEPPETAG